MKGIVLCEQSQNNKSLNQFFLSDKIEQRERIILGIKLFLHTEIPHFFVWRILNEEYKHKCLLLVLDVKER
jgi:hypothetical protein